MTLIIYDNGKIYTDKCFCSADYKINPFLKGEKLLKSSDNKGFVTVSGSVPDQDSVNSIINMLGKYHDATNEERNDICTCIASIIGRDNIMYSCMAGVGDILYDINCQSNIMVLDKSIPHCIGSGRDIAIALLYARSKGIEYKELVDKGENIKNISALSCWDISIAEIYDITASMEEQVTKDFVTYDLSEIEGTSWYKEKMKNVNLLTYTPKEV